MLDPESSSEGKETKSNVLLLGLVSLINDISSEIIQPVLPLFIASLGGGAMAVGIIGGIGEGLPSLLKVLSGYWADRVSQRKPFVVAGYALSAAAKLAFPLAQVWTHVLILKTAERCGKGIRSAPRDAIVAGSVSRDWRGRGFGILRALDSLGAVLGSLMAYLLWTRGLDLRAILLLAGLLAFVSLIPLLPVKDPSIPSTGRTLRIESSLLPARLWAFVTVASVFALANLSYMFFILRAEQLSPEGAAVATPLILYVLFNLVYSTLSYPAGVVSDRIGRGQVLSAGYLLFSFVALGFVFVGSLWGMVLLFALYGAVYAMVDGTQSALVSDLSPGEVRSTALGVYYGATGLAALASGIMAGTIWSVLGPEVTFTLAAGVSTLAAIGMVVIQRHPMMRSRG